MRKLRDSAWAVSPFPCIGTYRFLNLGITKLPQYEEIVSRVRIGETFLALGCCFGIELRKVLYDAGMDGAGTYAVDLRRDYLDLGLDFFGDGDSLKTKFVAADIFDEGPGNLLTEVEEHGVGIIYAGSFIHLFDREHAVKAVRRIARMLRPKAGSMVVGRQRAKLAAGKYWTCVDGEPWYIFRHNEKSFPELWSTVGEEMGGVKFDVELMMDQVANGVAKSMSGPDEGRRFTFCVRRL